jgi:hypothetical protein
MRTGATRSAHAARELDLMRGELVTETLDYDGGRRITAYVPPRPPEAIVFAGDGQVR